MYTLGIDAFASQKERSGVEWYSYHLLRAMQPLTPPDWRVFLYTLGQGSNYEFKRITNDQVQITHPAWQWKPLRWLPRRGWGQVRLSWEMFRRPPNVLFIPGGMIPLIHPHRQKQRQWTVTTIHDVGFLDHPELYHPADLRRQQMALAFANHHAARILVPSEATRESLRAVIHSSERIHVTPLGVDHERYRPDYRGNGTGEALSRYSLKQPFLMYIGRINSKKNLETLLEVFAEWSRTPPEVGGGEEPLRLVLVGSFGFGGEAVREVANTLGVAHLVQFLGYVSEDDLPFLYHGAHAFVFPSAAEGFGLPVLQALASGVPTLASDIPALREIAGEAALFADPKKVEDWKRALEQIINDESLRQSLRERGPGRAKNFSWQETARKTWNGIEDLIQ